MIFMKPSAKLRSFLVPLFVVIAGNAYAASFDCNKARSQVEHLICDTPTLSSQDEALAVAYKTALESDPAVRQRQLAWLRETRDRCTDAQCLTIAYQTQIQAMGEAAPAMPAIQAQPQANPGTSALQVACPVDWSALADIDGPNPDRAIFGIKARDWQKAHLDMVLAKTKECQSSTGTPESLRRAELADIQTRAYPNAVAAIERRDQRLRQEEHQAQLAALANAAPAQPQEDQAKPAPQLSERELARQQRDAEFAQQSARNAEIEAQRQIERSRNDKLWIGGGILAAIFAAWFWNKFIRNRCPKCKSTDYDTTSVDETDRWRGTKKVTEQHSRGSRTRHVSATYVKKLYSYRCRACQTEWAVEKKEEL